MAEAEQDGARGQESGDRRLTESVFSTGATQALWFFTKAKVALAVAIVKTRPAGMSGKENAEALACKLRSQDESWKRKAEGLQQEVLRLRQEMLMARVMSDKKSTTEAAGPDSAVEDISQDLFGSGCDSETPELLQLDPQPAVSDPQLPLPGGHDGGPWERALHPHVHFLQSLCALHRIKGNTRSLEALWFSPDGDAGSVLRDSVCQLLDSVVGACRDPLLLGPHDLVLRACQVAAQAMDLFCSQKMPSVEFTRRVEESLRELTGMLLHHNHQFSTDAERLMEYLTALGSSSMSTSFLIRHVLAQISALADQLWQAFQGQENSGLDKFPLDQYQNSCHLFWIVEELLQKSKVPCRVDVGSEQTGFLRHLEQRIFLLSDEFPLFSICMWRIGGQLTSSGRQDPPQV